MALFPQRSNGSNDNLLWMKFNELVTLLNRSFTGNNKFIPTIRGSTANGTWTYTTQQGNYSKNGATCFISIRIKVATIAGSPTGTLDIVGLPYPASADSGGLFTVMPSGLSWGVGATQIVGWCPAGSTVMNLYSCTNNGAFSVIPIGNLLATDEIIIQGKYFI